MNKIKIDGVNYVSLRVNHGYYSGNRLIEDMYCIKGQMANTLHWVTIEKSFTNREDAIKTAVNLRGTALIPIYDITGYSID